MNEEDVKKLIMSVFQEMGIKTPAPTEPTDPIPNPIVDDKTKEEVKPNPLNEEDKGKNPIDEKKPLIEPTPNLPVEDKVNPINNPIQQNQPMQNPIDDLLHNKVDHIINLMKLINDKLADGFGELFVGVPQPLKNDIEKNKPVDNSMDKKNESDKQ